MIERYCDTKISQLWSQKEVYLTWLDILIAWAKTRNDDELVQKDLNDLKKSLGSPHSKTWSAFKTCVQEAEEITKHDVAAFIDVIAEDCGPPTDRWIAYGLTSSDIVDTGLSLIMRQSLDWIMLVLANFMREVEIKSRENVDTLRVGRTHGQYADLTTFRHTLDNFQNDLLICYDKLCHSHNHDSRTDGRVAIPGMFSGPVGVCDKTREHAACRELNIPQSTVSTQVISRVNYASVMNDLGLLSSVLAKWAVNFRLLMQSEVDELRLPKGEKAKGSSSMPHKTNPVALEKITGLERLVRGYVQAVNSGIQLWGERDISHSCVERIAIPDTFHTVSHQLTTFLKVMENIEVNKVAMLQHAAKCPASRLGMDEAILEGDSRKEAYEKSRDVGLYSDRKDWHTIMRENERMKGSKDE